MEIWGNKMNKNLKAIILAGGYDQIALIKELKNRNYFTILIDYYSNPPAKDYADIHYQVSTLDTELIKEIAIKESVNLITTACTDQALLSVAQISEELNLPCYMSYEKALNVTNKMHMKYEMKKAYIPTARHIVVSDVSDVKLKELKFPVVVKPSDCNSSKGVKKTSSFQEGILFIKEALELSRSKTAIIEEFIEGFEISVDAFVTDGKVDVLLITESEKIKNTNGFTITQSKYPVDIDKISMEDIQIIVQSICMNFNIINGPLLVQLIISDNNVFVVEFSARMGGGTKYKLIEVLTGFDIMNAYVDLITDIKPKVRCKKQFNYAHLNYCYASKGVFDKPLGFDDLMEQGIIYDYFIYKSEGAVIDKSETSSDRVAGYLITADTIEDLNRREKLANDTLKILSKNGKDIMRHDLI